MDDCIAFPVVPHMGASVYFHVHNLSLVGSTCYFLHHLSVLGGDTSLGKQTS